LLESINKPISNFGIAIPKFEIAVSKFGIAVSNFEMSLFVVSTKFYSQVNQVYLLCRSSLSVVSLSKISTNCGSRFPSRKRKNNHVSLSKNIGLNEKKIATAWINDRHCVNLLTNANYN
jgi:hypothetical protein